MVSLLRADGLTGAGRIVPVAPDFLSTYQELCIARTERLHLLSRWRHELRELQARIDAVSDEARDIGMHIDHLKAKHPELPP